MKVLLVPTTEGYGHVSRANAIIGGLEKNGIDYSVLTDRKRADFLVANGVDPSRIDASFYGIRYIYTGSGKNVNVARTLWNLVHDSPEYRRDYRKVVDKTRGAERFDLVINDVTLPLCRLPQSKVITPCHYNAPKSLKDHRRITRHAKSVFSEYLVEPMVNLATCMADKFNMDFRPHYIDYERVFPPVVSDVRRQEGEVRKELDVGANDLLILDGRNSPPLGLYERFARENDDVYFLARSKSPGSANVRTKEFIAGMIEYINAADLFITDTGFTAISEGVITRTPMLFADPGSHIEGFKNYSCALDEGFGKAIGGDLEKDLALGVEGKVPGNQADIPNGLPHLMKKIMAHAD
jgi:hypothetical protein